jgi:hypothetical protein
MTASVRIVDYRERFRDALLKRLGLGMAAAAEELKGTYAQMLSVPAPPHSDVGGIPKAYNGFKPGGYGPVNSSTTVNNIPPVFDQVQTDSLVEYLGVSTEGAVGEQEILVGFRQSHVGSRDQNYLIWHDQNGRPWVERGYIRAVPSMVEAFKDAIQ